MVLPFNKYLRLKVKKIHIEKYPYKYLDYAARKKFNYFKNI